MRGGVGVEVEVLVYQRGRKTDHLTMNSYDVSATSPHCGFEKRIGTRMGNFHLMTCAGWILSSADTLEFSLTHVTNCQPVIIAVVSKETETPYITTEFFIESDSVCENK